MDPHCFAALPSRRLRGRSRRPTRLLRSLHPKPSADFARRHKQKRDTGSHSRWPDRRSPPDVTAPCRQRFLRLWETRKELKMIRALSHVAQPTVAVVVAIATMLQKTWLSGRTPVDPFP